MDIGLNKVLKNNPKLIEIELSVIAPDEQYIDLTYQTNPISSLRVRNFHLPFNVQSLHLLALESPMMGYMEKETFHFLTGYFTYVQMVKSSEQSIISPHNIFPCLLLEQKPSYEIRRYIILHDLVRRIIQEAPFNDPHKIMKYLKAWFRKDEGRKKYI